MATTAKPIKNPVIIRKATTPTMKSSSSQNNVKRHSNPPRLQKEPPPPITTKKKTPSTPVLPSPKKEIQPEKEENLEPISRIRSNSYTINRSESFLRNDLNLNPVDSLDERESIEPSSSKVSIPNLDPTPIFTEDDFRANLGKQVTANGQIGILRYFGPVHFLDGLFCGIEFDRSIGLHDGQVDGRRYFKVGFKRGTFWQMQHVQILNPTKSKMAPDEKSICDHDRKPQIWPSEGELLTEIEPNLLERPLDESQMSTSAATFDLSSSLSFLKGSRFPGMDISMTPSELMAQLQCGGDGGNERQSIFMNETDELLENVEIDYSQWSGLSHVASTCSSNTQSLEKAMFEKQLSKKDQSVMTRAVYPATFSKNKDTQDSLSSTEGQMPEQESKMLDTKFSAPVKKDHNSHHSKNGSNLSTLSTSGQNKCSQSPAKNKTIDSANKFRTDSKTNLTILSHNAKACEAFAVIIQYYNEKTIPDLHCQLIKAKETIGQMLNAKSNQENENRSVREDYQLMLDKQKREYEQQINQLEIDFQKRILENSETIRKKIIEEQKAILVQKEKTIEKYKYDCRRWEKIAKDYSSEITSLRTIVEMRTNELRDLQIKSQLIEQDLSELTKLRQQIQILEKNQFDLEKTLEKKIVVEIDLLKEKLILEEKLHQQDENNRKLKMGKEEVEYKLLMSQSLYEPSPNQFLPATDDDEQKTNLFGSNSKRRSRSMLVGKK